MPLENPNEAVRPDFTTEEHGEAHQQVVGEGLTEDQATHLFVSLWTLTNNANKVHWAMEREWMRELHQCKEEKEEDQHN